MDPRAVSRAALVTAALLALPASALWDAAGHRTVAAIAWEHMTPRARARAAEPLPKGDQGGNTCHLDDNRNLHAYWDRILDEAIAPEPGEDSIAYASRIARQIDRVAGTPAAGSDVLGWAHEGLRLAQTFVYSGVSRGSAPSAAYQAEALKVSEAQIALAGYRLAALLNAVLTP